MPESVPTSVGEAEGLRPEQRALVREHLDRILSSPNFAGSPRTQEFLRLIVAHTLEGDHESLRERMIGAELYGRPVSYDTGSDSVVRVRASEVRKKLAQYYSESRDEKFAVRIELPSGSYVPRFHFEAQNPPAAAEPETHPAAAHESAPPARPQSPAEEQKGVEISSSGSRLATLRPRGWLAVAGVALLGLLIALLLGLLRKKPAAVTHGIHSIVILPLNNLSGVADQDYFADGMTEELINELDQVSTLRVISLTSSMSYKGTKKTLPEIARELSVDGVVEGGVLRDEGQVRVSVQLIDAGTDRPVWARSYVRDLNSAVPWQGEVAQAIAEAISIEVTPQVQARLARQQPVSPEEQDLYLHGVLLRNQNDCKSAIAYFDRAIAADPGYAQAHSALATCYGMLGESGRMSYADALTKQKAEALRAIELDDSLSEAHAELGNTEMTRDWDWPAAALEFRRALKLNPNSATNHEKYAFFLVRTGHPQEAIAEIERSVELDPISGSTLHAEGFIYYFARQYARALEVTRTARGLGISLADWSFLTGDIYAEMGKYPESIAAFLKSGDDPYSLGHLGNVYARAGQKDAALRTIAHLQEHVRKDGVGRYEIALVYAGLGEKNDAFQWLEEAERAHDVGMVYLEADPCLDPLRGDPRFHALLQQVGLVNARAESK